MTKKPQAVSRAHGSKIVYDFGGTWGPVEFQVLFESICSPFKVIYIHTYFC